MANSFVLSSTERQALGATAALVSITSLLSIVWLFVCLCQKRWRSSGPNVNDGGSPKVQHAVELLRNRADLLVCVVASDCTPHSPGLGHRLGRFRGQHRYADMHSWCHHQELSHMTSTSGFLWGSIERLQNTSVGAPLADGGMNILGAATHLALITVRRAAQMLAAKLWAFL